MYACDPGLSGIPSWLQAIGNKIVKGTTVTVPTPAGPVSIDLGNKASVDAARRALTGTRVSTSVANKPASPIEQFSDHVENNVPGGWLTVGLAAAAALFLLSKRRG